MSSVLSIMQIVLVTTYIFFYLANTDKNEELSPNSIKIELSKNAVYILSLVNLIILMMIHISLEFFSTDEAPVLTG
jgi:hypothetical protein